MYNPKSNSAYVYSYLAIKVILIYNKKKTFTALLRDDWHSNDPMADVCTLIVSDLPINCPGLRKVEGLVRVRFSRPVIVIACSNLFSLLTKWSVAWIKKNCF